MLITKKDKKLLLLIVATGIVIWFCYILLSALFYKITFSSSKIEKLTNNGLEWLNSPSQIKQNDLKNRIIITNFWSYSCISCINRIAETEKLEEEFADKITVINVHIPQFDKEKSIENVKKAIIKNGIRTLVVNDFNSQISRDFKITSLPTTTLINQNGKIDKIYQSLNSITSLKSDISNLLSKKNTPINIQKLPINLEKDKNIDYFIKFPSSLEFIRNFSYKNTPQTNGLAVSNVGKNNILIISLTGEILLEIGDKSGKAGFVDGSIENAAFNYPHGLLFKDNILYVADTGNNAIRKIDFKNNKISTIAGTGSIGDKITQLQSADQAKLSSPWDLAFFPDNSQIIISNSATNQLLKYNINNQTISPFAGNGKEGSTDGKYPNNSFSQPTSLATSAHKLYLTDSKSSSIRYVEESGEAKTVFNNQKNSNKILLQNPIGISVDDTGIYIADTYNNSIRKFNFKTKEISNYSGEESGKEKNLYQEPEAIISVLNKFYISDTNNGRIIELDRNSGKFKPLNITPSNKTPKEINPEYLFDVASAQSLEVKHGKDTSLICPIEKGWQFNPNISSFINLFEIKNDDEAVLIATFDEKMLSLGAIKLPKLSGKKTYYLQGIIYYCQDKQGSVCLIKNYQQKLIPKKFGNKQIVVQLIYQNFK